LEIYYQNEKEQEWSFQHYLVNWLKSFLKLDFDLLHLIQKIFLIIF